MFSKGSILQVTAALVGVIISYPIIKCFIGMYLKNTIALSNIDYVKTQTWNKSMTKTETSGE